MKWYVIVVLVVCGWVTVANALRIETLPEPATSNLAVIGLVDDEDEEYWEDSPPLWTGKATNISASAWAAQTTNGLLLHVEVADPNFANAFRERNIWRGDCLYVALDARGDTPTNALAGPVEESDDAVYIFALGEDGPEGRTSQHGISSRRGVSCSDMILDIDENRRGVTYDLHIPWAELNTAYGQAATLGLALLVSHSKEVAGSDIPWGRIRATEDGPREYHYLALAHATNAFVTMAVKQDRVVSPEEEAVVTVALLAPTDTVVMATLGDDTRAFNVAGGTAVTRLSINVPAASIKPWADELSVAVIAMGGEIVAKDAFELSNAEVVRQRFTDRINALLLTAPNAIVTQHLESTRAVVDTVYMALPFAGTQQADENANFMNKVERIMELLPEERIDWEEHVRKALPVVHAFVSHSDHSLQFYALQFPYDWDPEDAYPLTVYLHGAVGNTSPLEGLSTAFDCTHQDTLFDYEEVDDDEPLHQGFVLAPWARGNTMYRGLGEDDVLQAIEDVKERYQVDEDRQYMTGFSMGCSGAWGIAARTPDMWAGINTASGFGPWSDTNLEYLDNNVKDLPIKIWIGELDGMVEGAKRFFERLKGKGMNVEMEIAENLPHTYPYRAYKANVDYLMEFARPPATNFSFTTDTSQHRGRNGVAMRVPWGQTPDPLPHFTCMVNESTVTIDSANTTGLTVDLGADGLGLTGTVTVVWNGTNAYTGPAETIDLGSGAGRR